MNARERIRAFFLPRWDRRFVARLVLVTLGAIVFFRFICLPGRVHGESMEPTYREGQWVFCWPPIRWFRGLKRGDIVLARLAGHSVAYLKRVVALEGDRVAFRQGVLWVNDAPVREPYLKTPCSWEWPTQQVKPGHVYLVGDNRDMPIDAHQFGQTPAYRILGVIL